MALQDYEIIIKENARIDYITKNNAKNELLRELSSLYDTLSTMTDPSTTKLGRETLLSYVSKLKDLNILKKRLIEGVATINYYDTKDLLGE